MKRFIDFARTGLLGLATAGISLSAACGSSIQVGSTSGGGGSGGNVAATSAGSGLGGGATTSSGYGGAATTSSGYGGGATTSSGLGGAASASVGTGGIAFCGGIAGASCPQDRFCDYTDLRCGENDAQGTCAVTPSICDTILDPVCGCDGVVYGNACTANAAGRSITSLSLCKAPAGKFQCGPRFCFQASEYCSQQISDVASEPDTYACKPAPAACGAAPTCGCLSDACGNMCTKTNDGGLLVTCPGG